MDRAAYNAVNDVSLGGRKAACPVRFIVWKAQPRRRKMQYVKFNRVRYGVRLLGAAVSRPSKPIGTPFLSANAASNSQRLWRPKKAAGRRMRPGGITRIHRVSREKRITAWTTPLFPQPLRTISRRRSS